MENNSEKQKTENSNHGFSEKIWENLQTARQKIVSSDNDEEFDDDKKQDISELKQLEDALKIIQRHLEKNHTNNEESNNDVASDKTSSEFTRNISYPEPKKIFTRKIDSDSVLQYLSVDSYLLLVSEIEYVAKTLEINDDSLKNNYIPINDQSDLDLNVFLFTERVKSFFNTISLTYTDQDLVAQGAAFVKVFYAVKTQVAGLVESLTAYSRSAITVIADYLKEIGGYNMTDKESKVTLIRFLEKMIESKRIETYEIIESENNFKPNVVRIKVESSQTFENYDKIEFYWYSQLDYKRNIERNVYEKFMKNTEFMKDLRKRLSTKNIFKSTLDSLPDEEKDCININELCKKLSNPESMNSLLDVMAEFEKVKKYQLLQHILDMKKDKQKLEEQLSQYKNKLSKAIETIGSLTV